MKKQKSPRRGAASGLRTVILAGGKGTRLRSLTMNFPKPLVPIGEQSVLEVLMSRLLRFGISDITLTLGHMGELMKAYFEHKREWASQFQLHYVHESSPTGTAGSLSLVSDLNETFLVMNGDILTNLNMHNFVAFHRRQKAVLTVATHTRRVKIDLGIIETDKKHRIRRYVEKPEQAYQVSMGIYAYEPEVLQYIKRGRYLDFPDLVTRLIKDGKRVCSYPADCLWLDVGRPDDYERAQELFASRKEDFERAKSSSPWQIPLTDLDYGAEERTAVLRVLRGRWLSMGPEVEAFEKSFARLIRVKHAIAVANATAALHLCYVAFGIGAKDEVVQPAINFVAAANMTRAVGATPIFADIVDALEPTIDPDDIEHRLTSRTKAVVVMHYGGYLCRMDPIIELCRRRRLILIEDACHAVGAQYRKGKMAGGLGDVGCFSFFSNKNLATGEGGMITTNNDALAARLRLLRSHGVTRPTWVRYQGKGGSYDVAENGYNYRLDEIHAALGSCQLRKLSRNNQHRGRATALYRQCLMGPGVWSAVFPNYQGDSAYHIMSVLAPTEAERERASARLAEQGIQTSLHYPCVPDFKAFQNVKTSGLKKSRDFARRVLTLPLYPTLKPSQVRRVCNGLAG